MLQKTDMVEVNLNTDYNERLLEEVGANLREIDINLMDTKVSLKGQAHSLKQAGEIVDGTDKDLKKANSTLSSLSWGQKVQYILLNLISIILFIGIIVLLILRILRSK